VFLWTLKTNLELHLYVRQMELNNFLIWSDELTSCGTSSSCRPRRSEERLVFLYPNHCFTRLLCVSFSFPARFMPWLLSEVSQLAVANTSILALRYFMGGAGSVRSGRTRYNATMGFGSLSVQGIRLRRRL